MHKYLLLFIFKVCYCDWVSEWLAPVRYQYEEILTHNNNSIEKIYNDENKPTFEYVPRIPDHALFKAVEINEDSAPVSLKIKLEEILKTAKVLTAALKRKINIVEERERILKETITNGRYGVTILSVSTLNKPPRTYLIRNGLWTLCNGIVQQPFAKSYNAYTEMFSTPRCIGQEVISKRDPCVFNSLIKYEIVPVTRRSFYLEDDYLCLKTSFNSTLETYMTVPKRVVDETCRNGTITSLRNNILNCGLRVLSEYAYYPLQQQPMRGGNLPLEYCNKNDGSCKLMVGWHVSNKTIENFEFFKNNRKFKNFFIKTNNLIASYT